MGSLVLTSVSGLIGPRKVPEPSLIGLTSVTCPSPLTQLIIITGGLRLDLAQLGSPAHENIRAGARPTTTRMEVAGGCFLEENRGVATKRRKSSCWGGKKSIKPLRPKPGMFLPFLQNYKELWGHYL